MINRKKEHKEGGTRLMIMLRGPGNVLVVGRCLKSLNTSAKRAEHSLAVFLPGAQVQEHLVHELNELNKF